MHVSSRCSPVVRRLDPRIDIGRRAIILAPSLEDEAGTSREIHSARSCLGDRTVKAYKQAGREQAPKTDERIASDTSQRQGRIGQWSVGNTGYRSGKFYAKVTKSPGCRGAFSETIKL